MKNKPTAKLKSFAQWICTLALLAGLAVTGYAALPAQARTAAPSPATTTSGFFQAISAGGGHTCALTSLGGVQCWGYNSNGQLGDGSVSMASTTPVDVSGLSSGVVAISSGWGHSCALTDVGAVWCWGLNLFGQLGNGANSESAVPVTVSGLTGVIAISAGTLHTCALTDLGAVWCWGDNGNGELGDGSTTGSLTPVAVSGLGSGVVAVSAGLYHTCAITNSGALKCWGANYYGQLGDGTTIGRLTPVAVSGLESGVAAVSAGYDHTCALTESGAAKCWGANSVGQLGDGTTTYRLAPVDVSGLDSGVAAISTGKFHTCALTGQGGVKCWGNVIDSHSDDTATINYLTPVDVSGLESGVLAISAGHDHTCALTYTGAIQCWGFNDAAQLGDGNVFYKNVPLKVGGLAGQMQAPAAGTYHTCALTGDGGVFCWGANWNGQLGDNTTSSRWTPGPVSGLVGSVRSIAAGSNHTCALTDAGGVKCWGSNYDGKIGDGSTTDRLTPVDVSGLGSGVKAIAAGDSHTCALTDVGGVKCWGDNYEGQLGDGTTVNRLTPANVSGLSSGVKAIAAGNDYTCAVTDAGAVKCWGDNWGGRLGDGTTTDRLTPVNVSGLNSGVEAIAASAGHTCAVTGAGGVKCWGNNSFGELGDGTTTDRLTPAAVSGLDAEVTAVAAGNGHTCALTDVGGVVCWGGNQAGQLGDGTLSNRHTPGDVSELTAGVSAIAANLAHTCAVTGSGEVRCWGYNLGGQLGLPYQPMRSAPGEIHWANTWMAPTAPVLGLCNGVGPCFSTLSEAQEHTSFFGSVHVFSGAYTETWTIAGPYQTVNLLGDVSLNGSLAQSGGAFNPGAYTLALSGDLSHSGGDFNPGTGLLNFTGSGTQTISGDTRFYNVTVGSGVTLSTTAQINVTGSLLNLGVTHERRPITGAGEQTFGLAGIAIDLSEAGDLSALVVERRDQDHPDAAAVQQTGRWWRITPGGGGYTATLTLPYPAADAQDRACRTTGGGWDCAAGDFIANTSVTRYAVGQFSDWAVGDFAPESTPPALLFVTRLAPAASPTNADSLVFRVTFDEAVQNVEPTDFEVSGDSTAVVAEINAVSAAIYDVTVSGGDLPAFNGTVGLGLAAGQDITDLSGNPLAAAGPAINQAYTLDNLPPSAQITSGPANGSLTNQNSATFEFSAADPPWESGPAQFCRLDPAGEGAAWAPCASPAAYTGLADGLHSFQVSAQDAAGNRSAPESRSWTVDSVAPAAPAIASPAAGSASDPTEGSQPTFSGTAEPGASVTVKQGAVLLCTATTSAGGEWICRSAEPLASGPLNIAVTAVDVAGNTSLSAMRSFVVPYFIYLPAALHP